jgi:hypothetical protein
VLGDAGGEPVTELRAGVEPLKLMVRPGDLKRGPRDLRGTRQRGRRARVEQPRPTPHQGHQEKLGLRVQVERQQGTLRVRRFQAGGGHRRALPPVPGGDRDRELRAVVHHGARADHRRPLVDEPAAGRLPVALQPGQPDPVAVTGHVECVRPADISDPGAFAGRRDHPGAPGKTAPARYRQVHLRASPEYQTTAFDERDDLAGLGTYLRGHSVSLSRRSRGPHPRIRG